MTEHRPEPLAGRLPVVLRRADRPRSWPAASSMSTSPHLLTCPGRRDHPARRASRTPGQADRRLVLRPGRRPGRTERRTRGPARPARLRRTVPRPVRPHPAASRGGPGPAPGHYRPGSHRRRRRTRPVTMRTDPGAGEGKPPSPTANHAWCVGVSLPTTSALAPPSDDFGTCGFGA